MRRVLFVLPDVSSCAACGGAEHKTANWARPAPIWAEEKDDQIWKRLASRQIYGKRGAFAAKYQAQRGLLLLPLLPSSGIPSGSSVGEYATHGISVVYRRHLLRRPNIKPHRAPPLILDGTSFHSGGPFPCQCTPLPGNTKLIALRQYNFHY